MSDFSATLRELMDAGDYTQQQVADALGVSHRAVGGWLNGAKPRSSKLKKMAELFHVSLEVLEGTAPRPRTKYQQEWDETNSIIEELPPDLAYNSRKPDIAKGWVMAQEAALSIALKGMREPLSEVDREDLRILLKDATKPKSRQAVIDCINIASAQVDAEITLQLVKNRLEDKKKNQQAAS